MPDVPRPGGAHEEGREQHVVEDDPRLVGVVQLERAGVPRLDRPALGQEDRPLGLEGLQLSHRIRGEHIDGPVADLQLRAEVEVADETFGRIADYAWSPDGNHLAFSLNNEAGMARLFIWSVAGGELRQLTSDLFNSYGPAWGSEGDYLFYISERHYVPQISSLEWNYAGNQRDGIYALALRKDVKPLFPPESDEVGLEDGKTDEAEKKKGDEKALHDFRVSIRRLRSTLQAYAPYLAPAVSPKQRRKIRRVASGTGGGRDAEVQLAWLEGRQLDVMIDEAAGVELVREKLEDKLAAGYGDAVSGALRKFAKLGRRLRRRLDDLETTAKVSGLDEGRRFSAAVALILPHLLAYNDEPLVSMDFNHTTVSSTFDAGLTRVIDGKLVKVCSWYDNEWGFSNRMLDTTVALMNAK